MLKYETAASFDERTGALIFRYECLCGLRSGWEDSPEDAEADRPVNCRAHDEHGDNITDCPACNVEWAGRTVADGATLIAAHMTRCMAGAT